MDLVATLPPEVSALADRLGASVGGTGSMARLTQIGTLRTKPESKWMAFNAKQWLRSDTLGFAWNSRTGPFQMIRVTDALIAGKPAGSVSLLGLVPLAKAASGDSLLKGQLMRYLAELPWNPDAILSNSALRWQVEAPNRISLSAELSGVTGSVVLALDDEGLPTRVKGIRPRDEGGGFADREWCGAFSDFRKTSGRLIPHSGRVGWVLDGTYQDVWRGKITDWSVSSADPRESASPSVANA